ncbi:MAG: DUF1080 domain-containing protein [Candidatus Hydrogenedentes bacterium]|nr:DUF1080 domain-containing protein [Candidatus Hydrogenedentota bacterium]
MKIKRKTFLWGIGSLLVITVIAVFAIRAWLKDPVPSGEPTPPPAGEGWMNLLDEAHAKSWANITDDKDIFEIADGMLHIFGRTVYPLRYAGYTGQPFSDFDLHLEFRLEDGANSGVFLRVQRDDPVRRGWEVQVLEDYGSAPNKNGCGAIYDVVTPMFNMSRPAGEWNSFDISVRGPEVVVFVNGWRVVHTDFSKMTSPIGKFETPFAELPKEGLLALQDHGGEVWYRNIFIKPAQ